MATEQQRGEKESRKLDFLPQLVVYHLGKLDLYRIDPCASFSLLVQGRFPNADLEETELLTPNFGYLAAERGKRIPKTRFPPSIGGLSSRKIGFI